MTKPDLIESLSDKLGLSKEEAGAVVDTMIDDIIRALHDDERVVISGFGAFYVSRRKARSGHNPKTGEAMDIPASRTTKFKPGKQLKESLNGSTTTEQVPSPE
jgi:DNA-binding protein HU-beta